MKIVKLSAIFVVLVGGIFLALNWGLIFGGTSKGDDFTEVNLIDNSEAYAAQAKAKEKNNQIASIIQFISTKPSLKEYKVHAGYKYLSTKEKIAIESFLNLEQYAGKLNPQAFRKLKNGIENATFSFKDMNDIYEVQEKITEFLNNPQNKKTKNHENS